MEHLNSILLIVQVLLSISLIALILLQHGKGADAGAAFGSGASAPLQKASERYMRNHMDLNVLEEAKRFPRGE